MHKTIQIMGELGLCLTIISLLEINWDSATNNDNKWNQQSDKGALCLLFIVEIALYTLASV